LEEILKYLSYGFIVSGGIIALTGGLTFLAEAYKTHMLWLICCVLLPPVIVVFLLTHWKVTKVPFSTMVTGLVILYVGIFLLDAIYK